MRRGKIMFLMNSDEVLEEMNKINNYLNKCLWMDFELCKLNFVKTVISGKVDISLNEYAIDIEFEYPYCVLSPFFWKTDTTKPFIELASKDEFIELNRRYMIEEGNYVFKIYMEDFNDSAIYIAAKKIKCIINNEKPFED